MGELIFFIIHLFYIRLCAKLGSERVIGGIDGAIWGIVFSFFGIFIVMASRRLDDHEANETLAKI